MRLPALLTGLGLVLGGAVDAAAITPEVFEAMSEGRTLYFSRDGAAFGAEQYFPGRRVLWRYDDGTCAWGRWHARDGLICFAYDTAPGPRCWIFEGGGADFTAVLVEDGAPEGLRLDLSGTDTRPLDCPGPGLGS